MIRAFKEFCFGFMFPMSIFAAILVSPVVAFGLILDSCDSKENPARYAAWMKATGNTNVSFNEWLTLKSDYLLPGQSKPSSTYVVPIYTGR